MTDKLLIILRGPACSGKSTLARTLNAAVVASADDLFQPTPTDPYQFDLTRLQEAHDMCMATVEGAMVDQKSPIVVDNTNVTKRTMRHYIQMAKNFGYTVEFREPDWSPLLKKDGKWNTDFLIEQSKLRALASGKVVEPHVIVSQCEKWENLDDPKKPAPRGNVFFTSDSHFGHRRICEYSNRPFTDLEKHDNVLIHNWNSLVLPQDTVYFLGDLCFQGSQYAERIIPLLQGHIFFIEGNHDKASFPHREKFEWWGPMLEVTVGKQHIVLCHYAMRTWNHMHHGSWHLYGHSHGSLSEAQGGLSMDVGVDAVAMRLSGLPVGVKPALGTTKEADYRPINIQEVAKIMSTKTRTVVDHHNEQTT